MTTPRTVAAGLALACLAAVAGCLDAVFPSAPRPVARLGLVPVFEGMANHDGIPADVDSILVTIHNPPARDTTVGVRIQPGQDSIVITIEVPLSNASADTVTMGFQAIRSSDGAVLYSGTQDIAVRPGIPARADTVRARYVGPGQNLQSIAISPRSVAMKPGDTLVFNVLALDSTGATIIGMPVLWNSRNTGIVTVSARGIAQAGGEGSTYVVVTAGARASVKDSAQVVVSATPPPVVSITLTPGFGVLRVADTVRLQLAGKDGSGNPSTPTGVTFTSRAPSVATVSAAGTVTGLAAGTAVVVAAAAGQTGSLLDSMLVAVAGSGAAVAIPLVGGRAFGAAKAGDTVHVVVTVDLRAVPGEKLGSYNAQLNSTPSVLRYVATATAGFAAPTVNADSAATVGRLRFGAADPNGTAGPTIQVVDVKYVAQAAGSSALTFVLTDLSGISPTFTQMLTNARVLSSSVRVQ